MPRLLPLQRHQLAGDVTEIGADDLALTRSEASAILAAYGVRPADAEVSALHERTHGWMTAMCLHALARHAAPADGGTGSVVADRAVAEFLRTEVLGTQPTRVRDLLLRTSILDEVHPDLADQLTGRYDARGILDDLVRTNAFVVPSDHHQFRYQTPLREMLGDELAAQHSELLRRLHGQAARWYREHHRFVDAVQHAVQVDDWDCAAEVAVEHLGPAWLLTAPDAAAVRMLLAGVPDDPHGPHFDLLRAILAVGRHDTAAASHDVQLAAAAIGPGQRQTIVRIGIATVRVALARLVGHADIAEDAVVELETLWSGAAPAEPADYARTRAFVLANLGAVQSWAGRVPEARSTLTRAAALTEQGTEYGVQDALAHLALLHLQDDRLHQAYRYAGESLAAAQRGRLSPAHLAGTADAVLAAVALQWNDLSGAREHLARASLAAGARHDPATVAVLGILRARTARGRLAGRRALATVEALRVVVAAWHPCETTVDRIERTAIWAHLAEGDTAAARQCLDRISDPAEWTLCQGLVLIAEGGRAEARRVLSVLSTRNAGAAILQLATLALGRIAAAEGDGPRTVAALRQALELGRPEQRRRPFVEAGAWVDQVVRQHPELAAEHPWLTARTGQPAPDPGDAPLTEALTDREADVLRQLSQALSTEDIAETMYLSINTVKTHLKSIYRKLGTSGRSAAVRRAREAGLLPFVDP